MVLVALHTAGIVLLIGVIIAVVLCALILFMPFRYQVTGDIDQKVFKINTNYLFRIIRIRGIIAEEKKLVLWILFFPITLYPRDEEKDAEKKKKRAERKKKKKARKAKKAKAKREKRLRELERQAKTSPDKRAEYERELNRQSKKEEDESSKFVKVARFTSKLFKLMILEDGIEMVRLVLDQAKYLAYHGRPRKAKADIQLGFKDPSTTGMILGGISMASFLFEYDIQIEPEFDTEETIFSGTFDVAGHICLIFVVIAVIRIVKVKEFRRFVKKAIKEFRKK